MAREPVLSGEIPHDGVIDVLREIEKKRITGRIRYLIGDKAGEVELSAGQIAMDQDSLESGEDPVEVLLAAREGTYAVHALLPALAVSQGDDQERRGSLAVHVPADLMTYCELAGLTGSLELRNDGKLVEVVYEFGELLAIRIDGREQADLAEVFAWDEGSFRVALRTYAEVRSRLPEPISEAPATAPEDDQDDREPTVRFAKAPNDGAPTARFAKGAGEGREDTGAQLLRMVEVALTDVVRTREKARASLRSTPPKAARSSASQPRPSRTQREATVRVVWLSGEPKVAGDLGPPRREERAPTNADISEPVTPTPQPVEPETAPKKAPLAASRERSEGLEDERTKDENTQDAPSRREVSENDEDSASNPRPHVESSRSVQQQSSPDTRWVVVGVALAFAMLIALHFFGSSH